MNFEDNNVIQVGPDSDGIVVATNFEREQPQIPTSGHAQLFHIIRTQVVCLMAVLISFSTTLIGNLFRLVNNSKLSIMTRACVLVAVAFVWSVFFAINSTGFAQTPGVTIAANTGMQTATIKEGEEISVIIQRTASASTPLDVTIKIEEITSDTSPANILEDSLESSATTATIPANATNLTYAISSQQDTSSTNGGTVVITLIASTADPITYSIPSQDSEKKVTFTVSHYEPTISIHPAGESDQLKTIREGEGMSVDVKRSAVAAFDLDVTISISETPKPNNINILEDSLETSVTITIPANELTFTYTIDSQQDSANGAGEAVFTLEDEDSYAIPSTAANQKVTFTVTHYAGPIVTIETSAEIIVSGNNATFTVARPTSSSSALTVVVTITATQGYLPDGTGTCSNNVCTIDRDVAIPANMTSQTHNESTKAVSGAGEGMISATIKISTDYGIRASKSNVTFTVNNLPIVDLTVPSNYLESQPFEISVTAQTAPTTDITVMVRVFSARPEFCLTSPCTSGLRQVEPNLTLTATKLTAKVTIYSIPLDGTADQTNPSFAQFKTVSGYVAGIGSSLVEFNRIDGDRGIGATVSIQAATKDNSMVTSVTEGTDDNIPFYITLDMASSAIIKLRIIQTGLFITNQTSKIYDITIPVINDDEYELELPLQDDSIFNRDAMVTVEILSGGYSISGTNSSFSVSVIDNDIKPTVSISSDLNEDDEDSVVEGSNFSFTLTLSTIPATQTGTVDVTLEFNANPSEYFSMLPTTTQSIPITVSNSGVKSGSKMLTVNTISIPTKNNNGEITVSIKEDSQNNYFVSEENPSITITVTKIIPVVSISSPVDQQTMREGDEFTFTLTSVPPPRGEIEINLYIFDNDSGFFNELSHDSENIAPAESVAVVNLDTSGTAVFKIATMEFPDSVQEDNSISVTVQDSTADPITYSPSTSDNSILVNVVDSTKEVESVISVFTISNEINIGQSLMVQITANPRPLGPIENVGLLVQTEGNLNLWRVPPPEVTLVDGSYSFRVHPTSFSGESEVETKITITLEIAKSDDNLVALYNPEAGEEDDEVETSIYEITVNVPPPSDEPPARISVADLAVTAILVNITGSSTSESPPVVFASANSPIISVQTTQQIINEGQTAEFRVTSSIATYARVQIVVSETGDFIAENISKSIQFDGNSDFNLSIPTLDDQIAEDDGKISILLEEGKGYLVNHSMNSAHITVSDASDRDQRQNEINSGIRSIYSQSIGTIGSHSLEVASDRINLAFAGNSNTGLKLNGSRVSVADYSSSSSNLDHERISLRQFLTNSSFSFDLLPSQNTGISASVWGRGDKWNLSMSQNDSANQTWSGDLIVGQLGFDSHISNEFVVGVSALKINSDVGLDSIFEDTIQFQSQSTGIHPYIGWQSNEGRINLNLTTGYGQGEILVEQAHYASEYLNSHYQTAGINGNLELLSITNQNGNITNKFTIIGDAWDAKQFVSGLYDEEISLNTHQYRISLLGIQNNNSFGKLSLEPNISVGIQGKTSNDQSIFAIEWGGGLNLTTQYGLSFRTNGQILSTNQDNFHEINLNNSINFDHHNDNLGLLVSISPVYGMNSENDQGLFDSSGSCEQLSISNNTCGLRLNSEIGYGIGIFDDKGRLTPFSGIDILSDEQYKFTSGLRFNIIDNLNLEINGNNISNISEKSENQLRIDGRLNW